MLAGGAIFNCFNCPLFTVYFAVQDVLKHYFGNHSLLQDLNTALELNQSLPVKLPPILVQSSEFDRILAKEDDARFDFNAALNSSIKQERIYSDLSTVLYEKMISITNSIHSFNPLRAKTWCLALTMLLTVENTCLIILLSFRVKGLQLALISLKSAKAEFIFNRPSTTEIPESTKEFWAAFQRKHYLKYGRPKIY